MSTKALGILRSKILELSEQDRAELAHDLIQSLDAPANKGVTEAWRNEVLRRIEQVDTGQAKLLDRAEFNRRVREHIGTQ